MTKPPLPTKRTSTSRCEPTGRWPEFRLREVFCLVGAVRSRIMSNAWLSRTWRLIRRASPLGTFEVAAYGACAIHLCEVSKSIVSRLRKPPAATAEDHRCLPATNQARRPPAETETFDCNRNLCNCN